MLAAIFRLPWLEALLWGLGAAAWYVYSGDGLNGPESVIVVGLTSAAVVVRLARMLGRTPPPPPPPSL